MSIKVRKNGVWIPIGVGVKGDKGEKGDQGTQGNQGNKGDQGNQGTQGNKGDQGNQGVQGVQGNKGNQGAQGNDGDSIKGQKGEPSTVKGNQGDKGNEGSQGGQGVQGNKGNQGDKGDAGSITGIVAGTRMLFNQTAAPTGWTKDIGLNNRALRLVSGSVGNGGATSFADAFNANRATSGGVVQGHVLTELQIPSHFHYIARNQYAQMSKSASNLSSTTTTAYGTRTGGGWEAYNLRASKFEANVGNASFTGSSQAHTHGFTSSNFNLNVAYTDVIIAQKD